MKIANRLNFKIYTTSQIGEVEIFCTDVYRFCDGEENLNEENLNVLDQFDKAYWADTNTELTQDEIDTYCDEIRDGLYEAISDYQFMN